MVDDAGTSAQRIRIGLTGLAFAFLLVLLASAISRSGQEGGVNEASNAAPQDPLAELGVAPRAGEEEGANNGSTNR